MHRLTPRHRRKAGSGPPAGALIAWISADPRLRGSAAVAGRQHQTDLPPPATTRTAKAAVITSLVLACGAVLGVAETVNDGDLVPHKNNTTLALRQNSATAPDQEAPSVTPIPVTSPIPVPPAREPTDHLTPHDPAPPDEYIHSHSPIPLAHEVSPPRIDQPNSPQPGIRHSRRYQ